MVNLNCNTVNSMGCIVFSFVFFFAALDLCIRPPRSDEPAVTPEKTGEKSEAVRNGESQPQMKEKEVLKVPSRRGSSFQKTDPMDLPKTSSCRKLVKYSSLGKRTAEP